MSFDPVEATRGVLVLHARGETILPDESYLAWMSPGSSGARSLGMPGLVRGDMSVAGTKIINANPANVGAGIPRAAGLIVLFDLETARPICILEAAHISALRTAAVTIISAQLMQARPIVTAALIGAGAQAGMHLRLMLSCLSDLRQVTVFDHVFGRAHSFHAEHSLAASERDVVLAVASSAQAAVEGAEMIATVTTTTTGYIPYEWLSLGTTLVNVSLDDPLPDVVTNADILLVDDWGLVSADTKRLLGRLYRQGAICGPEDTPARGVRKVDATLGDVLTDKHSGRTSADEIALVNPFGMAIEDLHIAGLIYEFARSEGIGRRLPFEG